MERINKRYWDFTKAAFAANVDRMKTWEIVVEKHPHGYVAYPLGIIGAVVGEGDSYEAALADCKSAIRFHLETFGGEVGDSHAADL